MGLGETSLCTVTSSLRNVPEAQLGYQETISPARPARLQPQLDGQSPSPGVHMREKQTLLLPLKRESAQPVPGKV